MNRLSKIFLAAILIVLGGCASVAKLEGEQTVQGRLTVKLSQAWNKLSAPGQKQPYDAWSQEGYALDQLRLWAGLRPGQSLMAPASAAPGQKAPQVPTFRTGMAPDQLAHLFEVLYAADGSQVQITRLEPASFAGESGVRFELSIIRKRDEVQLLGMGWVAVRKDELFAMTYVAPRLGFFQRGKPGVEVVVASARIGN